MTGKTTTSEQMLYMCGEIKNVGRVDTGDTVMDYLPQERERGITISSAAISFRWKDTVLNLIDTPGHVDFTIEVERSVRVMDGAVVIIDAVSGVQAQTRTVWRQCQRQNMPAIAFINKLDREGASFEIAVSSLKRKINVNAIPVQLPIGSEDKFTGVFDLIGLKKIVWLHTLTRAPPVPTVTDIVKDDPLYDTVLKAHYKMLEDIAEVDDIFMEKYLEVTDENDKNVASSLSVDDILSALRRICIARSAVPVICGSSLKGRGVEPLLDAINCFLPSPMDRSNIILSSTGKDKDKIKTIAVSDGPPMIAFAFKIVYDKQRGGPLVFLRIFSGELHSKDVLYNSSNNTRERANQIFKISAGDLIPIDKVSIGDIACVVGLKGTSTGNTLVLDRSPLQSYVLSGVNIPDAVFSLSIEPEKSSQQDELEQILTIMCLEDPSLKFDVNPESGQILIKGIGELHLEIVCDKLRRQYNIPVSTGKTYVAYRETIDAEMGSLSFIQKYERIFGTKRMFAALHTTVTPLSLILNKETDSPLESDASSIFYIDDVVKRMLSAAQVTSLEAGLRGALQRGPNGYPIVGLQIAINNVDLDADSLPGAIQACAAALVDDVLRNSGHGMLLEPVMTLEAEVPEEYTGDILSDISVMRRGVVKEVVPSTDGARNSVLANVPLSSMLGYATAIRSMTKGDCTFSIEYLQHEKVADMTTVQQ